MEKKNGAAEKLTFKGMTTMSDDFGIGKNQNGI